jgi:NAD(P)-dependent dehydrogenase (short-subunit alcohol dehydrogenase family)
MTKSLDEKVAIVTGASRNLGRAFSEMLGTEGASVVVHYNNPNKKSEADDTAVKVRGKGGAKAIVEQADLTKTAEIKKLFDNTMKEFNQLDILINTAGMVIKKPFVEISEEEYDSMFAINAKAAFFCMQEAAKRSNRVLSEVLRFWVPRTSNQTNLMVDEKQHRVSSS